LITSKPCEICGSNDLIKIDGTYVCQNCGIKYSTDEVKKLPNESICETNKFTKAVFEGERSFSFKIRLKLLKYRLVLVISIIICIIIGYSIYWNVSYSEAKRLYGADKCHEAMKKIDNLLYFGGNSEFDKILFVGRFNLDLRLLYRTFDPEYQKYLGKYDETENEPQIWCLISGFETCIEYEIDAATPELKELYNAYVNAFSGYSLRLGVEPREAYEIAKIKDEGEKFDAIKRLVGRKSLLK